MPIGVLKACNAPQVDIGPAPPIEKQQIEELLQQNNLLFATELHELRVCSILKYRIPTGTAEPIKRRQYRLQRHYQKFMEEEVDKLLKNGLIQPSFSSWSAPGIVVPKKNGKLRLCMDYRGLNSVTTKDAYPLPRIDEMIDNMHGAKYFSSIDLASGYWQFEVHPKDRHKTAFSTPKGLFE